MEKAQSSHFFKFLGESLIVFCILLGILLVSLVFMSAIILLPAPLIFITVRRGFFYGLVPFVLLAVLFGLLFNVQAAVFLLALFAPAVYFISYVIRKKTRAFESVVFSVGAFALGIAFMVGYIYITAQTDLLTYLMTNTRALMEKHNQLPYIFLQALNISDLFEGVKSLEAILALPLADAINDALAGVRNLLVALLPLVFSVFSLLGGLLNYVIVRAVLKKKNTEVAPIPAFSHFKLPKGFFTGMLLIAAVLIGGSLLDMPGLDAVLNTAFAAYVIVFCICGLALIDFMLKRRNATRGTRIAVLIVVPVFGFLLSQDTFFYALAVLGLLESVLKVRDRIEKPDEFDGE